MLNPQIFVQLARIVPGFMANDQPNIVAALAISLDFLDDISGQIAITYDHGFFAEVSFLYDERIEESPANEKSNEKNETSKKDPSANNGGWRKEIDDR
jgi:hypothetical protein